MRKIAIIGMGNIGKAAARAVSLAPDMKLCGFVTKHYHGEVEYAGIPAVCDFTELPQRPEGAIICLSSLFAEETEKRLLEAGINTVDAFDIHEELPEMRERLSASAERGGAAAIIGAGWDPGLDSVIRTLMLCALPRGNTYTDFGPGMSMGHSVAARAIPGIRDAISFTLPLGFGKHCRKIYAVPEENAEKTFLEHAIFLNRYFEHDECSVEFVPSLEEFYETGHGVKISRHGAAAGASSQRMKFSMEIENPSLTAELMVCAMRAAFLQKPGAYFLPEIPPSKLCAGVWEKFL